MFGLIRKPSLDHLVSAAEQRAGNSEPERPGGPEVEEQFDLRRLLHRQIGRLLILKDSAGVYASQTDGVRDIASVAHQSAGRSKLAIGIS